MHITISVIKADVGSPAGHTKPSETMLAAARTLMESAISAGLLVDGRVTYTGDDTALTMVHTHGTGAKKVHRFAWDTFLQMTQIAQEEGLYAAGQDLLVDAPAGNVKGAGPGVAEISFDLLPSHRPAEAFMVWTADKCGPGLFNLPLRLVFGNPDHNTGLLMVPELLKGFTVTVLDVSHLGGDSILKLSLPQDYWQLVALLRDPDRFVIEEIHSKAHPKEQIVSVAATRLHNIAGKYVGKDDPAAIVRVQKIFPAPEEVLHPWFIIDQIVTGDCRGSHNMPILPVAVNTAVTGAFCLPVVSAVGYSINNQGKLSEAIDFFDNVAWDEVRLRVLKKAAEFRKQGAHGVALASQAELAYTGLAKLDEALHKKFSVRK